MNLNLRQNADNIGEVSSWRECARRCASLGSCQLWTWHTGTRHCAAMDSAGTKTFDASSMAGRWDCTALYCIVLCCTVGGTATTMARLTREVTRIFSCLCLYSGLAINV